MARPPVWRKKEIRFVLRLTLNGIANDEIIRAFNASFLSFQLNSKKIKYVRATYGRDPAFGAPLTTGKIPWDPEDSYGDVVSDFNPYNPHTCAYYPPASVPVPGPPAPSSQAQQAHSGRVDEIPAPNTPASPHELASLGDLAQVLAFNEGYASVGSSGLKSDAASTVPDPGSDSPSLETHLAPLYVGVSADDWLPSAASSGMLSNPYESHFSAQYRELLPRLEGNLTWDGGFDFSLGDDNRNCEQTQLSAATSTADADVTSRDIGGDGGAGQHTKPAKTNHQFPPGSTIHRALGVDCQAAPASLAGYSCLSPVTHSPPQPPPPIPTTQDRLSDPTGSTNLISFQLTPPAPILPSSGRGRLVTASEKEFVVAIGKVRRLEMKLTAARKQLGIAEAALRMERLEVKGHW